MNAPHEPRQQWLKVCRAPSYEGGTEGELGGRVSTTHFFYFSIIKPRVCRTPIYPVDMSATRNPIVIDCL